MKSITIISGILGLFLSTIILLSFGNTATTTVDSTLQEKHMQGKITKSDSEWREILTEEEYYVLRQKGTERAFSGKYDKFYEDGKYYCAACGNLLFNSSAKYNSGSGWPSFYEPAGDSCVETETDNSFGMTRAEVHCAKCGGHLGHIFEDGPPPTGLRYCINSVSLKFKPEK